MARGGTNVLWNILGSHPAVCNANKETGELFTQRRHGLQGRLLHSLHTSPIIVNGPFFGPLARRIDETLYRNKLETLQDDFDKYKTETEIYTEEEVANSVLCLKSVHREHELNPLFEKIYPECHFIGLIRDGYALCEGWTRRGFDARMVGGLYRSFGEQLQRNQDRFKKHLIIRFEDALEDPFGMASRLFEFVGLSPVELPALRLKSKQIQSSSQERSAAFGKVNQKYWFTPTTIGTIIKPDISTVQSSLLDAPTKAAFEARAKPTLEHFGYSPA